MSREDPELKFGDESYKVVVNTKGCRGKISEELKEVIMYSDLEKVTGGFSRELDDAVRSVKDNEANRLEYLRLYIRDNEMRAEAREEGRKEGEITQTVKLYRSLLKADVNQIRNVIMKDFDLSMDEANAYLIQQAAV